MKAISKFKSTFSVAFGLLGSLFSLMPSHGFGQTYCTPSGQSCGSGKTIFCNNFYVGNYRATPPGSPTTIYPAITSCPAGAYTDFRNTGIPTPTYPGSQFLVIGEAVNASGLTNSDIFTQGLWIDLNNDGVFNSTNESIMLGSSNYPTTVPIGLFFIPNSGITFGLLNCRLRTTLNQAIGAGDACTSFSGLSHTVDFKINLIPYCFQPATCKMVGQGWSRANYFNTVNFATSLGNVSYPSTFDPAGYSDYRSKVARVPLGTSFTVSGNIYRESPMATTGLAIWADWNNDRDFNDVGELVGWQQFPNSSPTTLAFSQTITPPANFTSPNTTIRLATADAGINDACMFLSGSFYGETEDYTLNLAPGGIITTSNESLCNPANPAPLSFSTLPTGSVYYNWYYQVGTFASQPTGTALPSSPWIPITNNNPLTGLPTMTSYDPPAGLTQARTYACFVTSRIMGNPNPGWALGIKKVKVNACRQAVDMGMEEAEESYETKPLSQNLPNPFTSETLIPCFIPDGTQTASLEIYGLDGRKIQQIPLAGTGDQKVLIQSKMLPSTGMYLYTLVIDGQKQPMMRMVLAK